MIHTTSPITHTPPITPFSIGRFLVSPLARVTDAGDYLASVSIRSGQGSHTHDRVFRFVPRFASGPQALAYAAQQGQSLIHLRYPTALNGHAA